MGLQLGDGMARRSGEEETEGTEPAAEHQSCPPGSARANDSQCGQAVLEVRMSAGGAIPGAARVAMHERCPGGGDDSPPRLVRSPTELDAGPIPRDLGGEATEFSPSVTSDEHSGGGSAEHCAGFDLLLVDLAGFGRPDAGTASRHRLARLGDDVRVVPSTRRQQFGIEDVGVAGCFEEFVEAVRVGGRIVVEDPDPCRVLVDGRIHRVGEGGATLDIDDVVDDSFGLRCIQQGWRFVGTRDVDGDDAPGARVQCCQRIDLFGEPWLRVVDDHDSHDGGWLDGGKRGLVILVIRPRPQGFEALPFLGFAHGQSSRLAGCALQLATLPLGESAPDTKSFVMGKCIFQAFGLHGAALAHTLGFTGGAALFREESLGVGLRAECICLPGERTIIFEQQELFVHGPSFPPELHTCYSNTSSACRESSSFRNATRRTNSRRSLLQANSGPTCSETNATSCLTRSASLSGATSVACGVATTSMSFSPNVETT